MYFIHGEKVNIAIDYLFGKAWLGKLDALTYEDDNPQLLRDVPPRINIKCSQTCPGGFPRGFFGKC